MSVHHCTFVDPPALDGPSPLGSVLRRENRSICSRVGPPYTGLIPGTCGRRRQRDRQVFSVEPRAPAKATTPRCPSSLDLCHWSDTLTTDYCNPPTNGSQHARQLVLAVALGLVLAVLLGQVGS